MRLTLDTTAGTLERFGNQAVRATRTGLLEEIDSTDDKEHLLYAAATAIGMPAMGSPHPSYPLSFLSRLQVEGISARAANIRLIYEPFSTVINSTFVITTGSRMVSYTTNYMPGSRIPIQVGYTSIPTDLLSVSVMKPVATISAFTLRLGTIDESTAAALVGSAVGYVNSATWMGRAPGCWLITEAEIVNSRYAGYRTVRATAQSAGPNEDHRTGGILRSALTGKYILDSAIVTNWNSALSLPYAYGQISASPNTAGFTQFGPYPTADFTAIFGF